jgi:hypothetical protein
MLIRRAEQAGYVGVTPHQFRHTFSDDWQMGRVASIASFPEKCDHDAVGMPVGLIAGTSTPCHRESAGQAGCMNVGCIRSIDVAPDSVAFHDRLLQPLQRQRRSDEGRCHQRPVVQLTHLLIRN